MIINGKEVAATVLERLRARKLPTKFLAGVVIGNDPASLSFQSLKKETAKKIGLDYRIYELAAELGDEAVIREIAAIGAQKECGGLLVQLPLPPQCNRHAILDAIPPEKDVDVLSEQAIGAFYNQRNPILPPVVGTVEEILRQTGAELAESVVAVVGLGLLIGRPVANWLMGHTKGLYLLGRGSDYGVLKEADLVIVGVGKSGLVTSEMLKAGAGVIDFGYSLNEAGKLAGDFDTTVPKDLEKLAFYTPTPGGTGPILISKLFENFFTLIEKQQPE